MKILDVYLEGYKRLSLSNISTIKYTPESVFQIILGTNGCGKSSLLRELSPLPAIPNDYTKNGKKVIRIEHKGEVFVLTSDFSKGNKHYFVDSSGENLNTGRTITVQRTLVEQYFGFTKEIQKLLVGDIALTELSASERRELLTKLSDVDYTFALGVYKNLTVLHRDCKGVLKHLKNSVVEENNKLRAIGDTKSIKREHKDLTDEINKIFELRNPTITPSSDLESHIKRTMLEIEDLLKDKNTILVDPLKVNVSSIEELNSVINEKKTEIKVNSEFNKKLMEEQDELSSLLGKINTTGEVDLSNLEERVIAYKEELKGVLSKVKKYKDFKGDPLRSLSAIDEFKHILTDILNNLPANRDKYFNEAKLNSLKAKSDKETSDLHLTEKLLDKAITKLDRFKSLETQTCPKCDNRFTPGRDESTVKMLEATIPKYVSKIESLKLSIEKDKEYINDTSEYKSKLRILRNLTKEYPTLRDFWNSTVLSDKLFNNPRGILLDLEDLIEELPSIRRISELKENISAIEVILNDSSKKLKIENTIKELERLDKVYESRVETINDIESELKTLTFVLGKLNKLEQINSAIDIKLSNLSKLLPECVNSIASEALTEALGQAQTELAIAQRKLGEEKAILSNLEHSQRELDKTVLKFETLSELIKILSPTEGIISKQLEGYIGNFITSMNEVISSIWNYELTIVPCGLGDDNLDYIFPFKIETNEGTDIVSDISKGSMAQKEIINFAFRVVAMSYLNIEGGMPIYLDEFGRTFDETHRTKSIEFVKSIINNDNYSQLFMVSHYASQFGAFSDVETLVLDTTNITVPTTFNTHVIIT